MNTPLLTVIIIAVGPTSCHSSVDNKQVQQKESIQSDKTGVLIQRELADSSKLTHIKGLFYRGSEGHLYERTIADREINGNNSLVSVEYFNGKIPQEIDPSTFETLDGWYAKDKHFAYYYRPTSGGMLTIKLEKADANSFEIFRGHYQYAADKNHVFKESEILENVKPEKAKVITDKNGDIISIK
jgi:DKNYY family